MFSKCFPDNLCKYYLKIAILWVGVALQNALKIQLSSLDQLLWGLDIDFMIYDIWQWETVLAYFLILELDKSEM